MPESNLKMSVRIWTADEKEQMKVANFIHQQLVGNKDYKDNNIILNIDVDNEVNLYIFEECKDIPTISI